jgi:TolB-like protein
MAATNTSLPPERRIAFRIGIHQGDIVVADGDIFGDGVNVAARLEGLAEPGGICVSARVQEDASGRLDLAFEDLGDQQLKNIARPVRAYRVMAGTKSVPSSAPPLPDSPPIAVLPFANLSGDPEQEYFADGMVEEIITALSRIRWLFVIARNSSFIYKGQAVDVKQVGQELGVRYVLEGSVRKAGGRVRIPAQLIETARISGPTALMARWKTCSICRTKSRSASPVLSSRHCRLQGRRVRLRVRPAILPPTTSTCAPMRWSGRRPGKPRRRSVSWSRPSRATRVMGRHSPGPRSAVIGCFLTIEAKIRQRIV